MWRIRAAARGLARTTGKRFHASEASKVYSFIRSREP
jgi:hypothetical protein